MVDDSMDTDTDRGPDSVSSSLEQWLSPRHSDSRFRSLGDEHSSTDADINLRKAHQLIRELLPHQDKQLMIEVYG